MKTYSSKQTAALRAEMLLQNAAEIQAHVGNLRDQFAKQFGACEGLNRFPISGGICEHWPEWAQIEIINLVRETSELLMASLSYWSYAGRRRSTWTVRKNQIFEA